MLFFKPSPRAPMVIDIPFSSAEALRSEILSGFETPEVPAIKSLISAELVLRGSDHSPSYIVFAVLTENQIALGVCCLCQLSSVPFPVGRSGCSSESLYV